MAQRRTQRSAESCLVAPSIGPDFRFRANPKLANITADSSWGNEKRIVWKGISSELNQLPYEDEESSFAEGADACRMHLGRVRATKLAVKAKKKRLAKTGALKCEVGEPGAGYIEAHHTCLSTCRHSAN